MARFARVAAWVLTVLAVAEARPLVRSIKDQNEFNKLVKHHAANTGLPVVADFFSDGCGPCRMMAPVFKALAKEYEGQAVFVKVDTATNRQLQSTYQVNSIPTFLFFGADGKKKNQFSGAGEGQLRQFTKEAVTNAERLNVKLSLASLTAYYATHEPSKAAADVAELHGKCAKMAKAPDCEGGAAADLAGKLKKKYKAKPGLSSRFDAAGEGGEGDAPSSSAGSSRGEPPKAPEKPARTRPARPEAGTFRGRGGAEPPPKPQAAVPAGPQLELASLAELEAAVHQRRRDLGLPPTVGAATGGGGAGSGGLDDEEDDEEEDDDDADLVDPKTPWGAHGGVERVVVLGGGPAGLAAAIYAARAGLKPVVVAPPFGGQLMGKGVDVENYPGLLEQTGPGVVMLMQKQAASFGTLFLEQSVVKVELAPSGGGPFVLHTNHSVVKCHALVVATGADSKWLGVPGEWAFRGGGVSTCATCDGFLFRDKPVVVVGGGDTAMEDALVLARTSSTVTVVARSGSFRASKAMAARVLAHPKITVLWHAQVVRFEGRATAGTEGDDDYVHSALRRVVVAMSPPGQGASETTLEVAAAFVAIGHSPNTQLFAGQLATTAGHAGYLAVAAGSTATSVPGVFAAGDVADHVYRQAITSAGSGAMAALDAERYLSERGLGDDPAAAAATAAPAYSEL